MPSANPSSQEDSPSCLPADPVFEISLESAIRRFQEKKASLDLEAEQFRSKDLADQEMILQVDASMAQLGAEKCKLIASMAEREMGRESHKRKREEFDLSMNKIRRIVSEHLSEAPSNGTGVPAVPKVNPLTL